MWWILAGCALALLLALEARRVQRERAEEANGPWRYAQYRVGQPDRALQFIEIDKYGNVIVPESAGSAEALAKFAAGRAGLHADPQGEPDAEEANIPPAGISLSRGTPRPRQRHSRYRI